MLYYQLLIGLVLLIVLASIITAVGYVTKLERFQITTIEVEGGKTISHDEIRRQAEVELEGNYYRLIPRRFALFYPHDHIVSKLKTIPRLKSVEVTKTSSHLLKISFSEYEPEALWCDGSDCVFLDENGFAFSAAPNLEGSALVRYSEPDVEVKVSVTPFSSSIYSATSHFVEELQTRLKLHVSEIVVRDEFDISYYLTTGAEIKISTRLPVEDSVTNLKTIFSNTAYAHLAGGEFNYIDLRFGDKVFVSEEEIATSSVATSSEEVDEVPAQ